MLSNSLIKKVNFVKEVGDAITKVQGNILAVEYHIFEHKKYGFQEYLVITYDGGAKTVRNCNGNSCSAIFEEISKYLEHGYYSEVEDYNDMYNDPEWILVTENKNN